MLLNDAPSWLIARYPVLLLSEIRSMALESADKVAEYVAAGGVAVVT